MCELKHDSLQLLDYGADVHNPGLIIRQSPLRVAVCDLSMDSDLVELLVSRGASPFLEDVDGQSCRHPDLCKAMLCCRL